MKDINTICVGNFGTDQEFQCGSLNCHDSINIERGLCEYYKGNTSIKQESEFVAGYVRPIHNTNIRPDWCPKALASTDK